MTHRDHDGRRRSGVWLPDECWAWLDATAQRDGTSRSDLVEGLVLLAMDEDIAKQERALDSITATAKRPIEPAENGSSTPPTSPGTPTAPSG